ncbi:MAG: hypothetical protein HQL50_04815 [Magnetococcales bacterium]|nr:hypothetical protein [Magnetococcales bacterium]
MKNGQSRLTLKILLLSIVVLVLGLSAIGQGMRSLHTLRGQMLELDTSDLPLAKSVFELNRQLLDQSLRFGEIVLVSETADRERFETLNQAFVSAGQRLRDSLREGKQVVDRAMDATENEQLLETLDSIKRALVEIEKNHGHYSQQCESIISDLYKYRFLDLPESEGDRVSEARVRSQHVASLKRQVSRFNDEVSALEERLNQAFNVNPLFSRTLSQDVNTLWRGAWQMVLTLTGLMVIVALVGGIILGVSTTRRNVQRDQEVEGLIERMRAALHELRSEAVTILASARNLVSQTNSGLTHTEQSQTTLKEMKLENQRRRDFNQAMTVKSDAAKRHMTHTSKELEAYRATLRKADHDGDKASQILKHLLDVVTRVRDLSANATAEARRENASPESFTLYTDELRAETARLSDLARELANSVDTGRSQLADNREHSREAREGIIGLTHAVETMQRLVEQEQAGVEQDRTALKQFDTFADAIHIMLSDKKTFLASLQSFEHDLEERLVEMHRYLSTNEEKASDEMENAAKKEPEINDDKN